MPLRALAPFETMQISASGLHQLRALEMCKLIAYWDRNGWALGYGQHNPTFNSTSTCTESDAETWLLETTSRISESVSKLVRVPVTQGQFDALVIFAYNIGVGAFASSSLLTGLNSGQYYSVPDQLSRWIYSDHKIDKSLVARREVEAALWKASSPAQNPTQNPTTETVAKG